jgi:hypothetical protein
LSSGSTGANIPFIRFEYYEEMEKYFGSHPTATPIHIYYFYLDTSSKAYRTHAAMLALIEIWAMYKEEFSSDKIPRIEVWTELVQAMAARNFKYSTTQCTDKFNWLKRIYLKQKTIWAVA